MKNKSSSPLPPSPTPHPAPLRLCAPALRRFRLPFAVLCLLALCAGCQSLTYSGPNGEHFTRRSFGSKTAISSLSVEATTNGLRKVDLRGYTNDSSQALSAVTEAAVRTALQAVAK